jgi:hypothetical protein
MSLASNEPTPHIYRVPEAEVFDAVILPMPGIVFPEVEQVRVDESAPEVKAEEPEDRFAALRMAAFGYQALKETGRADAGYFYNLPGWSRHRNLRNNSRQTQAPPE